MRTLWVSAASSGQPRGVLPRMRGAALRARARLRVAREPAHGERSVGEQRVHHAAALRARGAAHSHQQALAGRLRHGEALLNVGGADVESTLQRAPVVVTLLHASPSRRSCSRRRAAPPAAMPPLPLSASALGELRALCAAAQRDPSLLHHASLGELRALMQSLGATLPPAPPPAAAGGVSAAHGDGNEDLRDDACVAPDTPSQEMGPPPEAGEPSEEVRLPRGRVRAGARAAPGCALMLRATPPHLPCRASAQAVTAASRARDDAVQAAAAGDWESAVAAYTTAVKARGRPSALGCSRVS
jgi:hypothetical protein